MLRKLYKFYKAHFWGINGAAIGFLVGMSFIILGFLKTLFLAICIFIGYFIGRRFQKDKNFLKNIIDKIIPPSSYR